MKGSELVGDTVGNVGAGGGAAVGAEDDAFREGCGHDGGAQGDGSGQSVLVLVMIIESGNHLGVCYAVDQG